MARKIFYFLVIVMLSLSCSERIFTDGDNLYITLSTDTIHFDTIFTTLGSVTRELKLYNPYKSWLEIDQISLQGGETSPYRINIDGESSTEVTDIQIAPLDSIYIFVDVIIDPTGDDNPVAILDSIMIVTKTDEQSVILVAWGQDIHLLNEEIIGTSNWTNDKPWVIYNSVFVDTGAVLTIDAGARVLFHRNSTMYVAGTLLINGEEGNEVTFGSDRIEDEYSDIPGQWNGIYFINISTGNRIEYSIIKNGVSGVHLGNLNSLDSSPDLVIRNSIVRNMTVSALSSLGGTIEASNCEFSHCGYYSLFLARGGEYNFAHCTIANLWEYSIRLSPAVLISDYFDDGETRYIGLLSSASFVNSVIYGSSVSELEILPSAITESLNVYFNNSLIRIGENSLLMDKYDFSTCYLNIDPGFIGFNQFDFRPDSLSILTENADPEVSILYPKDLRGYNRFSDTGPDIGAYERQPGELKVK
jgi:hypothetical protein